MLNVSVSNGYIGGECSTHWGYKVLVRKSEGNIYLVREIVQWRAVVNLMLNRRFV
jgi:hypothetical protein